jgi:acyl-CoA synthetase (AMP-forming)/AMP-acid ligase II
MFRGLRHQNQGMTCVRLDRYVPEDFLDAIQKYRVQAVPIVPPVALMLAKSPLVDKYDLSSLKSVMVSAAPTKLEVVQMLRRRLQVKVRAGLQLITCDVCLLSAFDRCSKLSAAQKYHPRPMPCQDTLSTLTARLENC